MAQSAEDFFGQFAGDKEAPKRKSAEEFFGDLADGKDVDVSTLTTPATNSAASLSDRLQAIPTGFNKGVAMLAGLPVDTAANVLDLAKAGAGYVQSKVTGNAPSPMFSPSDRSQVVGSGEWIASQMNRPVGNLTELPRPDDAPSRLIYGAASGIPGGLTGGGASVVRPMLAGGASGLAAEGSAELGADPGSQALIALATGAGASVRRPRTIRPQDSPSDLIDSDPTRPSDPNLPNYLRLEDVDTQVPARTAETLEMSATPASESALTASGSPRKGAFTALDETPTETAPVVPPRTAETVEMPKGAQAKPLTASGAPRKTAYSDLEGDTPRFVEETPVAHNGMRLPQGQRQARQQILQRIGLTDDEIRLSATSGDAKAAATDYQTSKLDNPGGDHLRKVLDNERAAITRYSEKLVHESGGTPGLGQTESLQRGQNIVAPLDDLKMYFDDGIRSLYKAADERAQGVPIALGETDNLLKTNKSSFTGTTDGQALYGGVKGRMEELGIVDADGAPGGVTVQQAEQLKQYLNEQWSPKTSRLIRRLKDAIDDDVTKAAGEDIYRSARALRAARGRILDDPKGISRIMDADGPEGINRAVAIEKIPDTMTTLPVAQFRHIVKTLQGVPEELQPQAQAALAEIKSQFANKLHEAGTKHATQWNAKGVTQYLNANSARMKALFSDAELANFATLNDAGHILRFDSSYPGAAAQTHNLARSGMMQGIEHMATVGGASAGGILGPVGAALGAGGGRMVGSKIAGAYGDRAALKAAQERTAKLSDIMRPTKKGKK